MATLSNRNCPLSEDFFYWPPEEISRYKHWCEAVDSQNIRALKKAARENKVNKHRN